MGSSFSNSCAKSKQKKENKSNMISPEQMQNKESSNLTQKLDNNIQDMNTPQQNLSINNKQEETIVPTSPKTQKTQEEKQVCNISNEIQLEKAAPVTPQINLEEEQFKKENSDAYFTREQYIKVQQYLVNEETQLKEQIELENQMGKQKWIPGKTDDKILGKGTFGTVVLGHNKNTGEIVAVKLIETQYDRKQKYKSIIDEVKILKQMRHKNIVRYYGIQEHKAKDHIGIVCEYVSGGSLWRLIQKFGKFSEPLIRKYTTDILYGLQYLHYHGITHRDIKGANILVDSDGVCKLADFGLAKSISQEIDEGQLKLPQGTPNWMAPEVCRSGTCNSRFSDIWSLGCTVYEMITGKPPFSNFLAETIILRVGLLKQPPQFLENLQISEKLSDFLLHCFQIKPEERWNVDQLLQHPFIVDTDIEKNEKSSTLTRKRNASIKKQYKKNSSSSSSGDNIVNALQEQPSKHELFINQQQQLSQQQQIVQQNQQQIVQQNQQSNLTTTFTVNVKNNQNKRDSLRTILEESNQQYSGQEDNTETNIRIKSPSLFYEEYSFQDNNPKDPSIQSIEGQKLSVFYNPDQTNSSIQAKQNIVKEGLENQLYTNSDQKSKGQKYKPVNSNAFLKDDIEEDQENQQQLPNDNFQTSQNNGLQDGLLKQQQQQIYNNTFNINANKIDEVDGEDDEENQDSPEKKNKKFQYQQQDQNIPRNQTRSNSKVRIPSKNNIKTKETDEYEEEENDMLNSKCLRGIPTERKYDEIVDVKINAVFEHNISNLYKQNSNFIVGSKSNQFEFQMPVYEDYQESSLPSPQKKSQ
ncbi:cyclin-dependent kinase-like Serine/Threonine kinase family protein (macronuclear) [Tetrahymena thermophila SB210]|uniref:Cyclin-dependent kinase-like Serine/Threonine kinase family protein n=1 Tax=Tetrahymena thermophila (strain SB210) TaxID=312017 RepID=I7LUF7_TETTS|nr:cyclin-dependent kinase-like Serine/Threonine kinase family protein [Tetrahymena thermophila SB210]EAR92961.2 cyclin-dependent kinase-like Serine/Threonine kinase family protein [Tetrahymena thermophila SB210]|eukprot:XP_001013206.2 cyclin-dependent kinase-like Serine/Threonine kinase family protein [Tetrahymena thermophila SB210]